MDRDIGLIYANARYLDPDTGRFLSFDPFAGYDDKPISLHRYLYAYQNPLRYVDPDGREAAEKFAIDAGRQAIIQSSGHMTTISAAEAANAASYSAAATWGSRALVLLSTGASTITGLVYSPRLADGTVSPEDQARYMREAEIQRVYEQRERERFLLNNPDLLTDARSSRFGSVTSNRQIPAVQMVVEDPDSEKNLTISKVLFDDTPNVSDAMARADNIAADVPDTPVDGIALRAEFKEGMNVKEFNRKINRVENAINDGRATSNIPHNISDAERRAVTRKYRRDLQKRIESFHANDPVARDNALKRLRSSDIDHMLDLQLDGQNVRHNLKTLDSRVNQDLGRQFSTQLPRGERVPIIEINVNSLPEIP